MNLNLNSFLIEVHENALKHGWWDKERPYGEVISLLHSEISEALEEYRAGRPNVWFPCEEGNDHHPCKPVDTADCLNFGNEEECQYRSKKPEGICIELLDAVIRILDWFGALGAQLNDCKTVDELIAKIPNGLKEEMKDAEFPEVTAFLHSTVTHAYESGEKTELMGHHMMVCMAIIFYWIRLQGEDAEKLIVMKHEYNKTRPYRHGNKVC